MARVYLIHGYLTKGVLSPEDVAALQSQGKYYFNEKERVSAGGQAFLGLLAGGPLGSALLYGKRKASEADALTRSERSYLGYEYFLNAKAIGKLGKQQYMVLDLPGGTYSLTFKSRLRDGPVVPISVDTGQTVFLLANINDYMGPYLEVCGDECADLVRADQRVFAEASGYPPSAEN